MLAGGDQLGRMAASDVPPPLRPLLGFDRRRFGSEAARTQFLRALDADERFRDEVFEAFTQRSEVVAVLGGWSVEDAVTAVDDAASRGDLPLLVSALFAARPEGWEYGLGVAVATHHRGLAQRATDDDRKAFEGRVAKAEEGRRRAEGEAAAAGAELAIVQEALREERAARREREDAAGGELRETQRRVEELDAELDAALATARAATEEGAGREAAWVERVADLEARLRAAEEDLAVARADGPAVAVEPLDALGLSEEDLKTLVRAGEVGRRVAARLGMGPGGVGAEPGERAWETPPAETPAGETAAGETPAAETPPPAPPVAPRPGRRARVALPPGVLGPTVEGLRGAVRADPQPAFVLDGYNISMLAWGDQPIDAQRQRLCALLERLALRTGISLTVIFDGADVEGVRPPRRSGVRVAFSPPGVEADEVVVGEVADLPLERPAVVVSSDGWVREHAEAEGALVVASDVFLEFLRRER